jgi:hypothetical protein
MIFDGFYISGHPKSSVEAPQEHFLMHPHWFKISGRSKRSHGTLIFAQLDAASQLWDIADRHKAI